MNNKPPCPRCHTADHVDPLASNPKGAWWCDTCNLVFTGTLAEWEHEQTRQTRAHENRTTPRLEHGTRALDAARRHLHAVPDPTELGDP